MPALERLCKPPSETGLLPTSGAAEAIALVLHEHKCSWAEAKPSEIGIPMPGYGAFRGVASLLGIPTRTYTYDPRRAWAPDLDEISELAKQCTALVITNPHNPTGHVLSNSFLRSIAQELFSHGGTLIVDEVFRVHDETESAIGLCNHAIVIGSLSKTYGLPGVRLGWIAAGRERLARLRTIQQYLSLTLNALAATTCRVLLDKPDTFSRAELIRKNRQILIERAAAMRDRISISNPLGGTTVCLNINSDLSEERLFDLFLQEGLLLAPGQRCFEFVSDVPWFRLGYGADTTSFQRGLSVIDAVLSFGSAANKPD